VGGWLVLGVGALMFIATAVNQIGGALKMLGWFK
jgi:hypothetical protein